MADSQNRKASAESDVSQQLRKAFKSSLLSQAEIARQADIDPGVLSGFINEERGISIESLDKLCQFLHLVLSPASSKRRPKLRTKEQ